MSTVKVIVLDIYNDDILDAEVEEKELSKTMAKVVAMPGQENALFTSALKFPSDVDGVINTLYVNDEGLFLNPTRFQLWDVEGQKEKRAFAGNGIIVGVNLHTGESVDTTMKGEDLVEQVSSTTPQMVAMMAELGQVI